MSDLKNSYPSPTGSELFSDSENYMSELSDDELDSVSGGTITLIPLGIVVTAGVVAFTLQPVKKAH